MCRSPARSSRRWRRFCAPHRLRTTCRRRPRLEKGKPMSQQQAPPPTTPYGAPISLDAAKKAMAAAEAEAVRNKWGVSIAIVDYVAHVVMLHRLDNAQLASARLAEAKARAAGKYRRPTKALEDAVEGGGVGRRVLTFGA